MSAKMRVRINSTPESKHGTLASTRFEKHDLPVQLVISDCPVSCSGFEGVSLDASV